MFGGRGWARDGQEGQAAAGTPGFAPLQFGARLRHLRPAAPHLFRHLPQLRHAPLQGFVSLDTRGLQRRRLPGALRQLRLELRHLRRRRRPRGSRILFVQRALRRRISSGGDAWGGSRGGLRGGVGRRRRLGLRSAGLGRGRVRLQLGAVRLQLLDLCLAVCQQHRHFCALRLGGVEPLQQQLHLGGRALSGRRRRGRGHRRCGPPAAGSAGRAGGCADLLRCASIAAGAGCRAHG
jgi:hypothetical protein